jgi:hypothetical protein
MLGMLDMDLVQNTARHLHDTFEVGTIGADDEPGYTWRVRRTLEAGLFTVYARPAPTRLRARPRAHARARVIEGARGYPPRSGSPRAGAC